MPVDRGAGAALGDDRALGGGVVRRVDADAGVACAVDAVARVADPIDAGVGIDRIGQLRQQVRPRAPDDPDRAGLAVDADARVVIGVTAADPLAVDAVDGVAVAEDAHAFGGLPEDPRFGCGSVDAGRKVGQRGNRSGPIAHDTGAVITGAFDSDA